MIAAMYLIITKLYLLSAVTTREMPESSTSESSTARPTDKGSSTKLKITVIVVVCVAVAVLFLIIILVLVYYKKKSAKKPHRSKANEENDKFMESGL